MSKRSMAARAPYIIGALATLAIGIGILLFAGGNGFLRGFMSDVVVVIFIYTAVKSLVDISPAPLAIGVFLFAVMLEGLQSIGTADTLGLTGAARTAMGTTFDWLDVIAYGIGIAAIYVGDRRVLEPVIVESGAKG